MVNCVVLNREAPGLTQVPYPGELGQRIFNSVSEDAWQQWIQTQTMIINENGLSTMDPNNLKMIEQYMLGYLFKEGDMANQNFGAPT